jgi:HD-like signal output (HDOD) protein
MSQNEFPAINLDELLSVEQLPAMPQTAIRLLDFSKDPTAGPTEFAIPIEADPGLTVQVLRYVNSSYFGFRNQITSIKQAITLVGVRAIKNFVLYNAVFSMIPNPRCGWFDLRSLWQDSLRRALFARQMGRTLGMKDAEETFAAALLQDMAVPLLTKEVPQAYTRLFEARSESANRVRLSRLEKHVFGWDHADAAGLMARRWALPEEFAVLIENHLGIEKFAATPDREPAKTSVSLSALLPTSGDERWTEQGPFEDYYEAITPPAAETVRETLAKVDEEFAEFAPVLRIAVPKVSLTDRYDEAKEVKVATPAAAPAEG